MRKTRSMLLLAGWLVFLAGDTMPARADASARQEGVTLRLVAEHPSEDGRFRAALLIDLDPGWKTYWLDPGEAGIPPSFDFGGSQNVEGMRALFPLPHRFDDGFSTSIVYSAPLKLALEGRATSGNSVLDLRLAIGICRDICIPMTAELRADIGSTGTAPAPVAEAFANLPAESSDTTGIVGATLSPDEASLGVTVRPAALAAKADLFVAAGGGWSFGPPSSYTAGDDGTATLTVPVTAKPRRNKTSPRIDAILSGPRGAWRVDALAVAAPEG